MKGCVSYTYEIAIRRDSGTWHERADILRGDDYAAPELRVAAGQLSGRG